jgi:hypothetical protein
MTFDILLILPIFIKSTIELEFHPYLINKEKKTAYLKVDNNYVNFPKNNITANLKYYLDQ